VGGLQAVASTLMGPSYFMSHNYTRLPRQ